MGLNRRVGNMYVDVTHTWNVMKGRCIHDCLYCFMKRFPLGNLRFDEKEFKTNLRENNFIFIGSSTDMWAHNVLSREITEILEYCDNYQENKYLFQSKDPVRFLEFSVKFPPSSIISTTIESNRDYWELSRVPSNMAERAEAIREMRLRYYETQITIEPILDFDLKDLVALLRYANPDKIIIGADSKGHNLPEPSSMKIKKLIAVLQSDFRIICKDNLRRLLK